MCASRPLRSKRSQPNLSRLRSSEPNDDDNRIFPLVYAGVIVKKDGQNLLTPMRYYCRPAGKPAFIDRQFPGLYNARRDNLEKFWGDQFGSHHAMLVVESFYENVKRHTMEHRELARRRKRTKRGAAIHTRTRRKPCSSPASGPTGPIRRNPTFADLPPSPMSRPADVAAAGHDRCIINLKPEHVEAWLTPQNHSTANCKRCSPIAPFRFSSTKC